MTVRSFGLILLLAIHGSCIVPSSYDPYVSTYVCKSLCDNLISDSSGFDNQDDMVLDMVQLLSNGTDLVTLLQNFGNYSLDFKTKQLDTLQAFKLLSTYGNQLSSKFHLSFASIIQAFYPDESCDDCEEDILTSGPGFVSPDARLLFRETISNTLEDQLNTKPLIDFPISIFPYFDMSSRRLQYVPGKILPPRLHFCTNRYSGRVQQQYCSNTVMENFKQYFKIVEINKINPQLIETQNMRLQDSNATMGFANLYLNLRFGSILVDIRNNCNQLYYDQSC